MIVNKVGDRGVAVRMRAGAGGFAGAVIGLLLAVAAVPGPVPSVAAGQADINTMLQQFDDVRALGVRGLMRAQDLKTARLYGEGFNLDMPPGPAEDMLIEGLWLIDYLNSMDYMSMSIVSHAAAAEHPGLEEEVAVFRAFLSEAARRALAYHAESSQALEETVAAVNEAARQARPFTIDTLSPPDRARDPYDALSNDGFAIGWNWPTLPAADSNLGKYLVQHGYTRERLFEMARQAGIDFIRPEDPNLFDWIDIETGDGAFDWSRIDALLAIYRRHGMAIWLPIPSWTTSPPQHLRDRLGNNAVLTAADGTPLAVRAEGGNSFCGIRDARQNNNPPNLFNAEVAAAFDRFVRALLARVQQAGVRIHAVEIGGRWALPSSGGPQAQARWQEWLEGQNIDPAARWGLQIKPDEARLPDKLNLFDAREPGERRMLADVVAWREDELIGYLRPQVAAIRAVAPGVPVCAYLCEAGEANESMDGRHNERIARALDVVPFHMSTGESIWDDLRRSYSGRGMSASSTHTGAGNAFANYTFSAYVHGTTTLWAWPTPLLRGFYWGDSFFYPDLRWQWSALYSWRRFHERAEGMAPVMRNTRHETRVAMLWSDTSGKFQAFTRDWVGGTYGFGKNMANYHKVGAIGWDRILGSISMPYDFVTEEQTRRGALGKYQMLIMPSVQALPGDVAQQVRAFVRGGGIVIATSAPALYGDDMRQQGTGALADVFGADFAAFRGKSIVAESPMIASNVNEPLFHYWEGRDNNKAEVESDSLRTLYCSFEPREGAEVLERFTCGAPAVILNRFGEGKAVVIGYPVGRESLMSDTYHLHYGHNWADWPNGSVFMQGVFRWIELLLPRVGFVRDAVVSEELAPRAVGQDAGWPTWQFTRKGGGYPDYVWKKAAMRDTTAQVDYGCAAPRGIELLFRGQGEAGNRYLTVYNREGAYGHVPGVIHFDATSKEIKIELSNTGVRQIFDITLGCAVPFGIEKTPGPDGREVATFRTMIEPSMGRMLAISEDDTIRLFAGARTRPRTDEALRESVSAVQALPLPGHVVLAADSIRAFLADRAPQGITISCESPLLLPAANRLADAIRQAYGGEVRVSRTSPRIWGNHVGLGVWRSERHTSIERADILLGSHNLSHHIASLIVSPGGSGHTMPLPIMASHTFPGQGRSVVCLTRPFRKRNINEPGKLFGETPAPRQLVIGASDPAGVLAGVENVAQVLGRME